MARKISLVGIYFDGQKFVRTEVHTVDLDNEAAFLNKLAAKHNMCREDFAVFDCTNSFPPAARVEAVSVKERNKDLEEGRLKVFKCKDCGRFWLLYRDEEDWFTERDLSVPKRCVTCRRKKGKGEKSYESKN